MNNYFYCYSSKMSHFIRAFGIKYLTIGFNSKSGTKYYIFEKSNRLDKIIQLYNSVKYSI